MRLGHIERHILVWGYRQHLGRTRRHPICDIAFRSRLSKVAAMFTYARDHLKIPVRVNRTKDPDKKTWIDPSFHNCVRKALPHIGEAEVARLVRRLHRSFGRALKSLHRKELIIYETGHHSFADIHHFGFFMWSSGYVLTKAGCRVAKQLLANDRLQSSHRSQAAPEPASCEPEKSGKQSIAPASTTFGSHVLPLNERALPKYRGAL